MALRKDRDKEFRKKVYQRFNNECCFTPSIVPAWMNKNIIKEEDKNDKCNNTDKLKIFKMDGNINNNSDANILLFCPYHYGVVYHELITKPKRKSNRLKGIRKETKKIVSLSEEELNQFFNSIMNPKHLMLFQMLYYLGARVNEIVNIKRQDIHINGNKGIVTFSPDITKRKVERNVNIPPIMIQPVKQYINKFNSNDIIFKMTKQRVWQLAKAYAIKSKLNKKIHPHTFRHSYASNIYNKTGDLKLIQELLGHKNLSTTSMYAHISDEYKRKKVDEVFG